MKSIIQGFVLAVVALGFSGLAHANEFTDVIDAFDQDIGDPFDINLSVGYERFQKTALIRREAFDQTPHDWDYYAYRDMFDYKQVQHILNLGMEIGLFRDLSLRVGLPLILNDQRELTTKDTFAWHAHDPANLLNSNAFKSPTRSGVDYISAGLWWGILDQGRDDTKPNWTFFVQGNFGAGETLTASTSNSSLGGISRGVNEVHFGTRLSRRFGVLDPYFGFDALLGFPKDGTGYVIEGNRDAMLNKRPPMKGDLDFGMEIVPWEIPEKYVKLSIILGGRARFRSEGREYTPLFDALGTSDFFLNQQPYVDFNGNGENDAGQETEALGSHVWSGMTDVENYAGFDGRLAIMMQPAKYVKFKIGTVLGHETEHFITKTDQCKGDNMTSTGCTEYNLAHRPEIDKPGNRFRVEKTFLFTFFIDAVAMF